ncbi:hypothetical protein GCM10010211_57830 [Streptomyces albospinus]|uniref:Uncharacterized protein n=1 Tax=Streptomyces albospinus TaxID=285515 RepID=A0ABQ2VFI1_9ACTN|nr:hypothetical protein GCM10010211_57830 [Streptomyces albospinus]
MERQRHPGRPAAAAGEQYAGHDGNGGEDQAHDQGQRSAEAETTDHVRAFPGGEEERRGWLAAACGGGRRDGRVVEYRDDEGYGEGYAASNADSVAPHGDRSGLCRSGRAGHDAGAGAVASRAGRSALARVTPSAVAQKCR